jgi:HAD superfamily hydrolase (TIGR01509 family)
VPPAATSLPPAARREVVVFDLDGTLVDSLPLVLRAFSHALEPFGPRPTMDLFAHLGAPPDRIFANLLGGERHVPAALERLYDFNRDHHHLIRPFDGVHPFLHELRGRGRTLAIWTGRDRETTLNLLEVHRLQEFFPVIVCGDDFATHKPDPEGLRDILRQVGRLAAETVFVGDADVDVLGGAACGVDTVLIRHAREVAPAILTKAWRTVGSPYEAYELLLGQSG